MKSLTMSFRLPYSSEERNTRYLVEADLSSLRQAVAFNETLKDMGQRQEGEVSIRRSKTAVIVVIDGDVQGHEGSVSKDHTLDGSEAGRTRPTLGVLVVPEVKQMVQISSY